MGSLYLLYFTLKGSLSWAFLRQVPPFKHAGLQVAERIRTSVRKNNVNIKSFVQIDKIRTEYFPHGFSLKFYLNRGIIFVNVANIKHVN